MAIPVPEEVAQERRRKIRADATRRGRTPSKHKLDLANWTIIVTSVPQEMLTLDYAFVLLKIRLSCFFDSRIVEKTKRWQIELLFKLWKRDGKIDDWRSEII
jgi:hypothetical protein